MPYSNSVRLSKAAGHSEWAPASKSGSRGLERLLGCVTNPAGGAEWQRFATSATETPLGSSVGLSKPFGWGFGAAHQPDLLPRLEPQGRL